MSSSLVVCLMLGVSCLISVTGSADTCSTHDVRGTSNCHPDTKFILMGSQGDLAKKYLWEALKVNHGYYPNLEIFGASRDHPSKGSHKLQDILRNHDKGKFTATYAQLKTDEDFREFCTGFSNTLLIFYLSIPPSAYVATSRKISKFCAGQTNRIRVAYEKPFGYDTESARELFTQINQFFLPEQIFLIDHYLGKDLTQAIIPFRRSYPAIEALLRADHVSEVEVRLLESLDCEGRGAYYDGSGVIRDMLQNHATELLTLLLTDIQGDIPAGKLEVLRSIRVPNSHQVVLGQYQSYQSHVGFPSKTPTFAKVLLTSDLNRWKGVNILLTSGKSQKREEKSMKITFKNGDNLKFEFKPARITLNDNEIIPVVDLLSGHITSNSYITLIKAVLDGDHTLLPNPYSVEVSWKLWDHVIDMSHYETPVLIHEDNTDIDIAITGRLLAVRNLPLRDGAGEMKFFAHALRVSAPKEQLYQHLVQDLLGLIHATPANHEFQLGLSGGTSIIGIYKYLLLYSSNIPWERIHLWQVDERCDLRFGNRRDLQEYLLDFIPVLAGNVHLMPVTEQGCEDPALYAHQLKAITLDYVILGVGTDGHTASEFPGSLDLSNGAAIVKVVEKKDIVSPQRMTMSLKYLNGSKQKAIIAVGEAKRNILQRIRENEQLPVNELLVYNLVWYIEEGLV